MIPIIWFMYVMVSTRTRFSNAPKLIRHYQSYLDRANIGNAKTGGMERDLHLTSTQYSIALLLFFVGKLPRQTVHRPSQLIFNLAGYVLGEGV